MTEAGLPITANALHPGSIQTDLQRHVTANWSKWFMSMTQGTLGVLMKSIPQGAATSVYCATAEEPGKEGGHYYSDCNVAKPMPYAVDPENAKRLWLLSEKLVGLKP